MIDDGENDVIHHDMRGSINEGYPKVVGLYWKMPFKWMMTGGTPIVGNLHIMGGVPQMLETHGW